MITLSSKMAELIHANVNALSVLQRLKIPLGVGDKTISEVCEENNVHPELFIYVIRLSLYDVLPGDVSDKKILLPHLISYLRLTHEYYLNNRLPLIEKYIKTILNNEPHRTTDILLLQKFFNKYKKEFVLHLDNEEMKVFPYVMDLLEISLQEQCNKALYAQMTKYSISAFLKEHDNLDEKLNDLQNIIIKYLTPFESDYEVHQILILLSQLEKDVFQHAQLEDLLMVPVVMELEKDVQILCTGR